MDKEDKETIAWIDIRHKSKMIERIAVFVIIVLLISGFICDCLVKLEHPLVFVENYTSYVLTVIQVQATVGTLIFTIIALIAGNISESYKGISVSDYYLNIKPWKLTQKVLIMSLLVLCLTEAIAYIFRFYNSVFFIFVSTLILIFISIMDIYSAFEGRNKYADEIDAYLEYMLDTEAGYYKSKGLFENFVKDWKSQSNMMDRQTYEEYSSLFKGFISLMWTYKTDDALAVIKKQSYMMTYYFLGSHKMENKLQGVAFLDETYEHLWNLIADQNYKESVNHFKKGFYLFLDVSQEYMNVIDGASIEDIQKYFDFSGVVEKVLRVDISLRNTQDNQELYNYECNRLNALADFLGTYLNKQYQQSSYIDQSIWLLPYNNIIYESGYNIPEEKKEEFLNAVAIVYFFYSYGLVKGGLEDMVINGLYLNVMDTGLDYQYQAFFYLSFHMFIYYLAIRGEEDCIPPKLRTSALNIWNNEKVKKAFENFIDGLSGKADWLNIDFLHHIQGFLRNLEIFPGVGLKVKWMMMDDIVSDFYVFIILYLGYMHYLKKLLKDNIDETKMWSYVTNENKTHTKEMLKKFYQALIEEGVSDEIINSMYDSLESVIKEKRKNRLIQDAEDNQELYEKKVDEKELIDNIKQTIHKNFEETFQPIYNQILEEGDLVSVELYRIYTTVGQIEKGDILKGHYQQINAQLLIGLLNYLNKAHVVFIKDRLQDFKDDGAYMRYLSDYNIHLLMGSEYILKNKSYQIAVEFNKFMEQFKTVYLPISDAGIGLEENAIQVKISDIDVLIDAPDMQEVGIKYDPANDKYSYDTSGIIIDLNEDEVKKLISSDYKTVTISVKLSIKVIKQPCGTIFFEK